MAGRPLFTFIFWGQNVEVFEKFLGGCFFFFLIDIREIMLYVIVKVLQLGSGIGEATGASGGILFLCRGADLRHGWCYFCSGR